LWRSMGYLNIDNARVTTHMVHLSPGLPGILERFTATEGQFLSSGDIIGWVEHDDAMRAPFDALVMRTNAVQGQSVVPGTSLAVVADINRIHIEANFYETDIPQLYLGQRVTVTIDLLGDEVFEGFVSNIANITSAELTGNAMFFNTGGTFTRVTPLIPVEVTLIDDVLLHNFIGVNARVRVPLR